MKKAQGFTLVEVLITIAILGVLGLLGYTVYQQTANPPAESRIQSSLRSLSDFLKGKTEYPASLAGSDFASAVPGFMKRYYLVNGGQGYCAEIQSSTDDNASYHVTNTNAAPQSGLCPRDTTEAEVATTTEGQQAYTVATVDTPTTAVVSSGTSTPTTSSGGTPTSTPSTSAPTTSTPTAKPVPIVVAQPVTPPSTPTPAPTTPSTPTISLSAADQALLEAQSYRPKGVCLTVQTEARHIATGVTYTFPTGCIPSGWQVIPYGSSGI